MGYKRVCLPARRPGALHGSRDHKPDWLARRSSQAQPRRPAPTNRLEIFLGKVKVKRQKIISEAKAFPSDQYMLESQVKFHGLNPDDIIVKVATRKGEHLIREEDILDLIQQ